LKSIGMTRDMVKDATIYRAKGCDSCFQTGYKGRISISEILVMESRLKKLVLKTFDSNQIQKEALNQNMETLRMDGVKKIVKGMTTVSEVLRVTQ